MLINYSVGALETTIEIVGKLAKSWGRILPASQLIYPLTVKISPPV